MTHMPSMYGIFTPETYVLPAAPREHSKEVKRKMPLNPYQMDGILPSAHEGY